MAGRIASTGAAAPDAGKDGAPAWLREVEECHLNALAQRKDSYEDPRTGYTVFTSGYLTARRKCCGSQCRHCPYKHGKVKGHSCAAETCPFQLGILRNDLDQGKSDDPAMGNAAPPS